MPPERSIGVSIVLTLVTCGIYDLFWDYWMGCEIRDHSNRQDINPGLDIFFMIITCNIYYFFWLYKMSGILRESEATCFPGEASRMMEPWLLVVIGLIGATLVSDAILQYDLNRHWDRHAA
jgi:glucan phosphoethanolaminetransferase (alkaline phosphatase superfamily)